MIFSRLLVKLCTWIMVVEASFKLKLRRAIHMPKARSHWAVTALSFPRIDVFMHSTRLMQVNECACCSYHRQHRLLLLCSSSNNDVSSAASCQKNGTDEDNTLPACHHKPIPACAEH